MISITNKRRRLMNSGDEISSGPVAMQIQSNRAQNSYIKGALCPYQFYNTCVPDTLLASFHILYIKHLNIRALLKSNYFFRILIETLNKEMYADARALWINQLEDYYKLNRFSNIKDHFPVIDKLVCAKVDFNQKTHSGHRIYEETLSKFRQFGDLRALGDISDPALILVHRDVFNPRYSAYYNPPLAVLDDKKRTFELEVLLIGDISINHMCMCFKLSADTWIRYDNDQESPFKYTDFEIIFTRDNFRICSAIYVNTTQAEDYKRYVPETRLGVEVRPFCLPRYKDRLSKSMDQASMCNLIRRLQNVSISSN